MNLRQFFMLYKPFCEFVAYDDVIVYFQSDDDDICLCGDDTKERWLDTFLSELPRMNTFSLTLVESQNITYILHMYKMDGIWECFEVTRVHYYFESSPNVRSQWVSYRYDVETPIRLGDNQFTPSQLCQLFNESLL